jgi:hypothetical protein
MKEKNEEIYIHWQEHKKTETQKEKTQHTQKICGRDFRFHFLLSMKA